MRRKTAIFSGSYGFILRHRNLDKIGGDWHRTASITASRCVEIVITDSQIRAAIRNAPVSAKRSIELTEESERGAGRLKMIVRPLKNTVSAEWYAVYYRGGRRSLAKLGSYPTMSVSGARKQFRENCAPAISAGRRPPAGLRHRATGPQKDKSVKGLFDAYIGHLEKSGKASAKHAKYILDRAATEIGSTKLAADVDASDIVGHLSDLHGRGVVVMAAEARAYISAAFNWAVKSVHDYTKPGVASLWGLKANPVSAIPIDSSAKRSGKRYLSEGEFRDFWRWLEGRDRTTTTSPVARLTMATGQRPGEILRLTSSHYDSKECLLEWPVTKNRRPHVIPLPPTANIILSGLEANESGIYFPGETGEQPITIKGLGKLIDRYLVVHPGVLRFTPRDLRRTWKTLAGKAGLSKEMRDRLQNHARQDVSTRHYDRYDYLAEKREAMEQWDRFLRNMLSCNETCVD
jgi:integrase